MSIIDYFAFDDDDDDDDDDDIQHNVDLVFYKNIK